MIDSHCHLADEAFEVDLDEAIARAQAAGLTEALCILSAGDEAEAVRARGVREGWPAVRFATGVHPHSAGGFAERPEASVDVTRAHAGAFQACGIGEIGLDYHYDFAPRDVQQAVFAAQLDLARERQLPVIIHTREATDDTFAILKGAGAVDGVFHCFTGDLAMARRALDIGFYVSYAGPHTNQFISLSADAKTLRLQDTLADGVIVEHTIIAREDEVEFQLTAHNPSSKRSEAHWAQPCVRLSAFMGFDEKSAGNATDYLPRCFIFLDGKLARLPTRDWATQARYVPGQVWCPAPVPRTDVNPRPLSPLVPDNGLIGAFGSDEKTFFATAWEPYQELFQGVARCLHSDFRLGGLLPGERRTIRGKIYLMPADVPALLKRYAKDFPEHRRKAR